MRVIVSRRNIGSTSGRFPVEASEETVEDLLASQLALAGGVVTLPLEGRLELHRGDEEGARLRDRLEVTVEFDGPGAISPERQVGAACDARLACGVDNDGEVSFEENREAGEIPARVPPL